MNDEKTNTNRRDFLKLALAGTVGLAGATTMGIFPPGAARAENESGHEGKILQVWSCGGLAEGMIPAHAAYEESRGMTISYTGAFAAVLGQSLMNNGRTEVFCGRVLDLAKKLREAGRMVCFKPFCYTSYVIVTPKGNPKKIATLEDLAAPGMKVAMAPDASPPGGAAVMGILKLAGLTEAVMKNVPDPGTCVQTTLQSVVEKKADAMIVELRLTRMDRFGPYLDIVPIDEKFFPPGPLTFTIGLMEEAKDVALAEDYIKWMTDYNGGQKYMEEAGFIAADSAEGRRLTDKLGVRDV